MSWENVTLADVKVEKPSPVPVGTYVFTLQPGANYRVNPYNQIQELQARFDVSEGDFAGRPMFVNYPDPTSLNKQGKPLSWSAQALKKLEIAIGQDALPGEDTATYLNRVAMNGARITAQVLAGKEYKNNKTGENQIEDPRFGIFTVSPAA